MKKIILIISILFLITGCANNKVKPEETIKTSVVFEDKVVENLIVRNHNVGYYDNVYHVYMDIYNENQSSITYDTIVIKYYNNKTLIYSIEQSLDEISSNKSYNISFDIDVNLLNANRVEYELKK